MSEANKGVTVSPDARERESFDGSRRGNAFWFTLFSSDRTPTTDMSAGIMVIPPHGGWLEAHRHQQSEIYFVASGAGVLTISGVEAVISAGTSAFIPGDAEHSLRNDGEDELRIFYVFPTDSFSQIIYRFPQA